jgi:hypothetical protein
MIRTVKDLIFYILSFVSAIYFIILQGSILINIVGWGIFFAHIYQLSYNLKEWPIWCEYIGFIFAIGLIVEGNRLNNLFAMMVGGLKMVAHTRQFILKDGRYYY